MLTALPGAPAVTDTVESITYPIIIAPVKLRQARASATGSNAKIVSAQPIITAPSTPQVKRAIGSKVAGAPSIGQVTRS
ncbi:MAG: hypothetical protein ACOYJ6_10940 [Caulobacterales bacterium]